jgi:hypothetical protein
MKNLTKLQEKLIQDLKNEFSKINPQQENTSLKRFSFESISNCINEEQQFHDTIKAHNEKMIIELKKVFEKELKDFKKEFKNSFDIQVGSYNKYGNFGTKNTFEEMIFDNKSRINYHNLKASETEIYFVSKTREQKEQYHPCKNMLYTMVYADFRRKKVSIILESGKEVSSYQIEGLSYRKNNWLHREKGISHASLDRYLQMEKSFQNDIVELLKN